MRSFLFVAGLFSVSLISSGVQANQVFPSGGNSGNACPQGSQHKGSGFCRATKPNYQFFPSGGNSGKACPGGSMYVGNGYCRSK